MINHYTRLRINRHEYDKAQLAKGDVMPKTGTRQKVSNERIELAKDLKSKCEYLRISMDTVIDSMIENYGVDCLSPFRLPFDLLLEVAKLYFEIEHLAFCPDCSVKLKTNEAPIWNGIVEGREILAALGATFTKAQGQETDFDKVLKDEWVPEDVLQVVSEARCPNTKTPSTPFAALMKSMLFKDPGADIDSVALGEVHMRYVMSLLIELSIRLVDQKMVSKQFSVPDAQRVYRSVPECYEHQMSDMSEALKNANRIIDAYATHEIDDLIEDEVTVGTASEAIMDPKYVFPESNAVH